jgi:hypothetical protein
MNIKDFSLRVHFCSITTQIPEFLNFRVFEPLSYKVSVDVARFYTNRCHPRVCLKAYYSAQK